MSLPRPPPRSRTAAETDKWKKISYVFIPFCVLYTGFVYVRHNAHHHDADDVRAPPDMAAPPPCHARPREIITPPALPPCASPPLAPTPLWGPPHPIRAGSFCAGTRTRRWC